MRQDVCEPGGLALQALSERRGRKTVHGTKESEYDKVAGSEESGQAEVDEFFDFTVEELREVISFLIQQREALRDEELRELEQEARKTIDKLHDIDPPRRLAPLRSTSRCAPENTSLGLGAITSSAGWDFPLVKRRRALATTNPIESAFS